MPAAVGTPVISQVTLAGPDHDGTDFLLLPEASALVERRGEWVKRPPAPGPVIQVGDTAEKHVPWSAPGVEDIAERRRQS